MNSVILSFASVLLFVGCALAQPTLKDTFKDHFLVGVALNASQFTEQNAAQAALVKKHFNSITPENVMKWANIHPEPDQYNFGPSDRYVEFGEKNGMFVIGHTLVWHQQTPRWVFEDGKGNPADRATLLARMSDHIYSVVGRYKGRVKGWDVVNEALNEDGSLRQTPWLKIIGPDYLAKAFEFAHAADPDAELYYNDFSLENEPKRNGAVALVKKLQAAGAHITGIGTQTHAKLDWPSPQLVDDTLTAFGKLGVKVMISDSLVLDPRLASEVFARWIAGQIEFWARLGRAVEPLAQGAHVLALCRDASASLFENDDLSQPFRKVAEFEDGRMIFRADPLPRWLAGPLE